jgi:hypothetical protein
VHESSASAQQRVSNVTPRRHDAPLQHSADVEHMPPIIEHVQSAVE